MKRYLVALLFLASQVSYSANTDVANWSGQGIYNAQDMVTIDNNYNLRLYNGSIFLGDNQLVPSKDQTQVTPSTTVGGFYGLKVPFYNGSGAATAVGTVLVASTTVGSNYSYMGTAAITATTTIAGISDGIYANGTVGWMTISGYSLVLSTGGIKAGDLLVSTAAAAGYAGGATGTVAVGTVIGKAVSTLASGAGGTVLAIIGQE